MLGGGSPIRKFVMCSAKEGVARELHAQDKPHPCPSPLGKGRGACVALHGGGRQRCGTYHPPPLPLPFGKGEGSLCGPTWWRSATLRDTPTPGPFLFPERGGEVGGFFVAACLPAGEGALTVFGRQKIKVSGKKLLVTAKKSLYLQVQWDCGPYGRSCSSPP